MSVRLYVGNLPKETIEREILEQMFAEAGDKISTKLIKDRKTGKCRGFAFVTVPTDEIADEFIAKFNGQPFMDSSLKIEKALPRTKSSNAEEGGEVETEVNTTPVSAPTKKKNNKRTRKPQSPNVQTQSDAIQPDPRWAGELAKLKEMFAAQAANS